MPRPLVDAMSGRARDVSREVDRIETTHGLKLYSRCRAVVAMKARAGSAVVIG